VCLSVRGIARRHAGVSGGFSVRNSIFAGSVTGPASLRARLESMARQKISFSWTESGCIFGGTAAWEQTWTQIEVRIRLNWDSGISNATMTTLLNTWKTGIENTWSNRWACSLPSEASCPLTIEVLWVATDQHHTIRVRPGPAQSDAGLWDTSDTGAVAAHEFGHLLGNPDEYSSGVCPTRNPVNTGTVMDNNSNVVPARLLPRVANNIGSNIVPISP
jgi:hypothetical protein